MLRLSFKIFYRRFPVFATDFLVVFGAVDISFAYYVGPLFGNKFYWGWKFDIGEQLFSLFLIMVYLDLNASQHDHFRLPYLYVSNSALFFT